MLIPSKPDLYHYLYTLVGELEEAYLKLIDAQEAVCKEVCRSYGVAVEGLKGEFDDLTLGLNGSAEDRELLSCRINHFGGMHTQAQTVCKHLNENLSRPYLQHNPGLSQEVKQLLDQASWVATEADRKRSLLHEVYMILDDKEEALRQYEMLTEKYELNRRREMYFDKCVEAEQLGHIMGEDKENVIGEAERRIIESELGFDTLG